MLETGVGVVIRVLFVDHETRLSGGQRDLVDLVRGLREVTPPGSLELHLALPRPGPLGEALAGQGVEVHTVPMDVALRRASRWELARRPASGLRLVPAAASSMAGLVRLARRVRPDVVHTNSMKAHVLALPAARLSGAALVWHVRDILEGGWLGRAMRAAAGIPAAAVCISHAAAAGLGGRGADRVQVVHNGVRPLVPDRRDVQAVRAALSATAADDVVVGIVGQIAEWKGQDLFLEVAERLAPAFPHARFVVVGDCLYAENESAYAARLVRRVESLGAATGGRVRWWGQAEPVEPVMAALDVLVHASRRPEPFGRVLVEAMALGVAVIASDRGAGSELVTEESGLLVPPEAGSLTGAVARLLADAGLRGRLAEGGRRRAGQFDVTRTARGVLATWTGLCRAGSPLGTSAVLEALP